MPVHVRSCHTQRGRYSHDKSCDALLPSPNNTTPIAEDHLLRFGRFMHGLGGRGDDLGWHKMRESHTGDALRKVLRKLRKQV